MKVISTVTKGNVAPYARTHIIEALGKMEGKKVQIEIKPVKRSTNANKYRWFVVGFIRDAVNKELREKGLPECSPEDIDIFIKDKALGISHAIPTKFGVIQVHGKLKEKTSAEFEESMEAIRAYFAERGVEIPLPNEGMYEM